MKHWNRNIWGIGSIGNATWFQLICNCKKDVVSLESFVWTWDQQRWLTPRQSRVRSYILLCFRKLLQKYLLVKSRANMYLIHNLISSKNSNIMLDVLIIYVRKLTLSQSAFKKYIWDHFTLHCEHCRWNAWNCSLDYRRGSRAPSACKTTLLVSSTFPPLTIVTKNSILDAAAPKWRFILIWFWLKWFHQNIMFMYFRSI